MGKARAAKRQAHIKSTNNTGNNVVKLNNFLPKKSRDVILTPRNRSQETYILELQNENKNIVFGIGPAGTGKTMVACLAGVKSFLSGEVERLVVTRPAVSADEDLGFLPGTLEEKMAPWTRPIFDVFREYFYANEIEGMIKEGIIEISPLAYMRGRTFKNSYIIADEMQNATPNQMKMLLTRIGEGSKMVVTGDLGQADRLKDNGLIDFCNHLNNAETSRISTVYFKHGDIERHEVVTEVLKVYGDA
jgi:phosphate starvation-inducible protein PhoH and related proteins|tara:strand:+ start:1664 stop:2404 length:741 start_codon:yes stop_codon:yes gene_type:complete